MPAAFGKIFAATFVPCNAAFSPLINLLANGAAAAPAKNPKNPLLDNLGPLPSLNPTLPPALYCCS
jgi:hypothetical protein